METPEIKKKKRAIAGWITTIGVHAIIVVLLLIFGFTTPLPKPEPEGISVDLGIPDVGGPDDDASMTQQSSSSASESAMGADATENSDNAALPDKGKDNAETTEGKPPIRTPKKEMEDDLQDAIANAFNKKKGDGDNKTPGKEGEEDGTEGKDLGGGTGIGDLDGLGSGRYIKTEPTIKVDDQTLCGKHLEVLVKVAPSGKVEDVEIRGIAESKTDVYNKKLYEQAVRDIKANASYTSSYGSKYQKATIYITIQCR